MPHVPSDFFTKTIFCIAISSLTTCWLSRWTRTLLLQPNLRTLVHHERSQNCPISTRLALARHRTWRQRYWQRSLMTPRLMFTGTTSGSDLICKPFANDSYSVSAYYYGLYILKKSLIFGSSTAGKSRNSFCKANEKSFPLIVRHSTRS